MGVYPFQTISGSCKCKLLALPKAVGVSEKLDARFLTGKKSWGKEERFFPLSLSILSCCHIQDILNPARNCEKLKSG